MRLLSGSWLAQWNENLERKHTTTHFPKQRSPYSFQEMRCPPPPNEITSIDLVPRCHFSQRNSSFPISLIKRTMKLTISFVTLLVLFHHVPAASEEDEFTYFEEGGLGPSNWASLDLAEQNECGGMMGSTSFGQSPVSIDETISEICDTGMSQYNFTVGNCQWTDLKFSINKGGTQGSENLVCKIKKIFLPCSPLCLLIDVLQASKLNQQRKIAP